ncbi:MAG TPA: universal stress protein [Verrucomicrobiae bacterium]|jgi:nucleotide-binding universal stress UspA family protein|nr:universal stress protein [Verrucomicrobiae bacterium]
MASKTYVVPVDFSKGSEAALKYAIGVARRKKARLVLVHVVPLVVNMGTLSGYLRGELEAMAKRLGLKSGEYRLLVLEKGEVAQAIANLAARVRAAMIIMGGQGQSGLKRFILGSVAERTLRAAKCPVLIVRK